MIRTTPVEYGTKPYVWGIDSVWQCTWYCYFRAAEKNLPYPCWYEGHGSSGYGSYTDAKKWVNCWRDPWVVKDVNYKPVENDIAVFDGEYGHVIFIEEVNGNTATCTEYRSGKEDSFRLFNWEVGTNYTGNLLGYLHCPVSPCNPVKRNNKVNQIQTTDDTLRIRNKPSLDGEIIGHVGIGYYNVLSKTKADGYVWYEIEKGKYCADITTKYLPASGEADIIKEIEKYFNAMKEQISSLTDENADLKQDMNDIRYIADKWK